MFILRNVYLDDAGNDGSDGGGGGSSGENSDKTQNDDAKTVADMIGDGDKSSGDRPEWLLDKYATDGKSVDDATKEQAKAYSELSGKFGSFTGAPDEYKVELSKELQDSGVEISKDDPLLVDAMKFAKDANMSQEGFAGLVNLYTMQKLAEHKANEEFKSEQMTALGSNADARIQNIQQWGSKNLDPETLKSLEGMATSADSVKAIERLISMTRNAAVNIDESKNSSGSSKEDVAKMQFEKDEHGNRKINTDPEFRARYQKMRNEVYGTQEHRTIIG